MDPAKRLHQVQDRVRSAVIAQSEKIERLGDGNPYAEHDAGYLSVLRWAEGVAARVPRITQRPPPD
jgi:hypothetical protein